jgi:hypothetical protein
VLAIFVASAFHVVVRVRTKDASEPCVATTS